MRVNKQSFQFAARMSPPSASNGGRGNDKICVDGSILVGASINGGDGNDCLWAAAAMTR